MRERQIQDRKKLERPDWKIVKKIMKVLKKGKIKKTHLAMDCRMNYGDCNSYLMLLYTLELVKSETDNKDCELVGLTERGMDYYSKHFASSSVLQMYLEKNGSTGI